MRSLYLAGVLLCACAAPGISQTLTFARDDSASYAGARAIATADFDRNGLPDLAQANAGRNTVTILLNHRNSGLTRAFDVDVAAGPFDLTTGDYNRDGVPDLAVANADGNSISVLLGRGDGSFTRADIPAIAENPRGITTADLNHDAKPDLIYSGYASRTVQVLLGTGQGTFVKGATYVGSPANPQGLAAADFNHDGRLEIALTYASSGGLRILYADGTSFSGRTIAGDAYLNVLAAGDFNHDGWDDVAAASTSNSTVGIYLGSATGLAHTQTYATGASPRGITAADVNDDGLLDIVTANRGSSTVSVLVGDRANPGTFLSHVEVGAAAGSRGVVATDFNADGRLDLATGNEYASAVTVLSNETAFAPAAYGFTALKIGASGVVSEWPRTAVAGDFNRDGRMDVATSGADDGSIAVLLAGHPAVSLPVSGRLSSLTVADFNIDGSPDVVYSAGTSGIYLGDGRGGFIAGPPMAASPGQSTAGDMNMDGRPDLALVIFDRAAASYALRILIGRGDGTFRLNTQVFLPEHADDVLIADINRDGRPDVVLMVSGYSRNIPASACVWFGTGDGGLSATTRTVSFENPYGVQIGIGDTNRDGFLDIVGSGFHEVGVGLGGAEGFSAPAYTHLDGDVAFGGRIAIGDLNLDGWPDVVDAAGQMLLGNGDGTFVAAGRFDFGGYANTLQIVDFNGDGLPDVLAASDYAGVVVLANRRGEVNHPPTVEAGPDRTVKFEATQGEDCEVGFDATASDPDAHWLTYEWRRDGGAVVSTSAHLYPCGPPPGSYVYSVTVRDGRGGVATDSVTVTILPIKEVVLWAAGAWTDGRWTLVNDPTAAGGVRAYDPNLGAPKVNVPLDNPGGRVVIAFYADPTRIYKLWIRLKADGNYWANDSVWVQFSGATDLSGVPKYRIGTTSALAVSLEECSNCGVSGWGWQDDGWGAPNANGVLLRFPQNPDRDAQTLMIQTREDGVSIDQIVLSAEQYLTTPPGPSKNDTTILMRTYPWW